LTKRKCDKCNPERNKNQEGSNSILIKMGQSKGNGSQPVSRVLSKIVIHLKRMSPYASSGLPGDKTRATFGYAKYREPVSLFGLAPGGVYPAILVTQDAVCSYHTFSPLPILLNRKKIGGIFSAALSVDSHPPGVTWHPALWSPDFPLYQQRT